ncbi:MAG: hypothetical protein JW731_03105, partial [Bacteroidales bacterium]|nr:hypothetical protein [Bacteroidales bacterium]
MKQFKMNLKLILVFFISSFTFQVISQDYKDLNMYLPEQNDIPGWNLQESPEIYQGDDLFSHINGGADIYFEYGFRQVVGCKYANNSGNNIRIEIYEMEDDISAFGIFTVNSSTGGDLLEIGDISFQYDYYIDVWKSNYFLRCTATHKSPAIKDTLQLFAKGVVSKLKSDGSVPKIVKAVDFGSTDQKSIKYVQGLIALGNVFNFGSGSVTGFTEAAAAKRDGNLIFVFSYENEHKRSEWFAALKGKMKMNPKFSNFELKDDGFTVIDRAGKSFCFKPYMNYFVALQGIKWEDAAPLF